jgi:hypothetical protein
MAWYNFNVTSLGQEIITHAKEKFKIAWIFLVSPTNSKSLQTIQLLQEAKQIKA